MPDNSSGFVDFNQYSEQNADEEQRFMEQAMQRAEAAQGKAQGALRKSEVEGMGRYGADGQITGEKALSQTASYSDYLKASKDAAAEWAAVNGRSRDPRRAALQGSLGGPGRERSAQAMAESAAREKSVGAELDGGITARLGERAKSKADAAAKQVADEERQRTEGGWRAATAASYAQQAKARAGAGGAQRDYFGGFNPYADSGWARQTGAWEAQQVKNLGGGQTAQRSVWDAYTGKGSAGYGRPPATRYQPMESEMENYEAPDEKDD